MQTNPAVEQNKNITWSESPWNYSSSPSLDNIGAVTFDCLKDDWEREVRYCSVLYCVFAHIIMHAHRLEQFLLWSANQVQAWLCTCTFVCVPSAYFSHGQSVCLRLGFKHFLVVVVSSVISNKTGKTSFLLHVERGTLNRPTLPLSDLQLRLTWRKKLIAVFSAEIAWLYSDP